MEEQLPYHFLLQLSPLAAVAVEWVYLLMVYLEEMVVEADTLITVILQELEEQPLLEVSQAVMRTILLVAVEVAQAVLGVQQQVPMAELAFQVQFLEAQRFMAAAAAVEVGKLERVVVKVVKEAVVQEEQLYHP
jgi:hypothetical protein